MQVLVFIFGRLGGGQGQGPVTTVDPLQDKFLFMGCILFSFGLAKHETRGHIYELGRQLWHQDLKHPFRVPT